MKKNFFSLPVITIAAAAACVLIYWSISSISLWIDQCKVKRTCVKVPQYERPEIYDRCGALLIGNRKRVTLNDRLRYAAVDGKFAAGFLGFTEFNYGREIGKSGIEKIIDDNRIPDKSVYVSIDSELQKTVENWMVQLAAIGKSSHIYAICLNSQGELLAAAQRPTVDINNRKQVNGGTCFFPAVYVFPVPDEFMKLLGSSSSAAPEEKEKFKFQDKLQVFVPEARGWFRPRESADKEIVPQAATAFNYLLAFIGKNEQKPMPQLQIFSDGKQQKITVKDNIEWLAVNQEKNSIAALAKSSDTSGNQLYFLICAEPQQPELLARMVTEIKKLNWEIKR